MEIFLIRHAQSQNNALPEDERVEDPTITAIGHQQCQALAAFVGKLNPTHLVTSPFLRALETARYVADSTDTAPVVWTDLHEQGGCMYGPTPDSYMGRPGMTRSQIQSQFPSFDIEPDIDESGWWGSKPYETGSQVRVRAQRVLDRLHTEFSAEHRVACVMHGDFKRRVLEVLDLPLELTRIPYNTSVTQLAFDADRQPTVDYNRIDHLHSEIITM